MLNICVLLLNYNSVAVQISSQTVVPPQLVAITQHTNTSPTARGPPLAVGRLAVDLNVMRAGGKGKAVYVLHTWKDHMFDLGRKGDPPGIVEMEVVGEAIEGGDLKTAADPAGVEDSPDAHAGEGDDKNADRSDLQPNVGSPPSAAPKTRVQPEAQLSKEGDLHIHLCCQLT